MGALSLCSLGVHRILGWQLKSVFPGGSLRLLQSVVVVSSGPAGPACVRHTPLSHSRVPIALFSNSFYNILSGHFLPGRVIRENCMIHHKPFF